MTKREQQRWVAEEMLKCREFGYFLRNYVWIRDVRGSESREVQWEWWGHHDEVVEDLGKEKRLVYLKARQLGFSWLLAAWQVHGAIFMPGFLGGVISQGQFEADEFLKKCKFVWEHLTFVLDGKRYPWSLKTPVYNTEQITFEKGGSVMAFPSTEKAGRGFTFNRMVVDEAAFHKYAEENYGAYLPATEQGQIVVLSSAGDGETQAVSAWFQNLWEGADRGENGFTARFYGWSARPGRDEAWYQEQRKLYAGTPGKVEREYPATAEEAFRSMLAQRFSYEAIAWGKSGVAQPLHNLVVPFGLEMARNYLKVWQTPRPGVPYVMYTDAAEGKGRDYSVTVVLEARTLRHVATLRDNILEPTQHAGFAVQLHKWFNNAFWGVEANKGEAMLFVIGQERIGRLYWHATEPTLEQKRMGKATTKRIGFPVDEHTRVGLLDDLGDVLVTYALQSPDLVLWNELETFIVNKNGRAEAGPGKHDDMVMAMAGAVRMARQPGAQSMAVQMVSPRMNYAGGF